MSLPEDVAKPISSRMPAAGLIAAAITATAIGHFPPSHFASWSALLIAAAGRVGLVFLSAALSNFSFCRTTGVAARSAWRIASRTALGALWLAPLALFVSERSAWTLVVTAILVITVGLGFRRAESLTDKGTPPRSMLRDGTLQSARSSTHVFAGVAALIAEVGAVAGSTGFLLTGTLSIAVACIVWVWSLNREWLLTTDSEARPLAKLAFTVAVILTALGLLPYVSRGYGSGGAYAGHADHAGMQQAQSQRAARDPEDNGSANAYSGIVVLPKTEVTQLVAPPPAILGENLVSQSPKPLVIPFAGVYWLFKAPDSRMPKLPHKVHGSPDELEMRSTDWHALSMEAHQNLGMFVDLGCCRRIQVAIRNADHYPGTVSLELVVSNTRLPGRPAQSLGTELVRSTRPWKFHDERPPTDEVLQFDIPVQCKVRRFDEFTVIFRTTPGRSFSAARVGIERFVLLPRGL